MKIPETLRSLRTSLLTRHQERRLIRGHADLHYALADSIGMLDMSAWQRLAENASFFLSYEYLAALEHVFRRAMP